MTQHVRYIDQFLGLFGLNLNSDTLPCVHDDTKKPETGAMYAIWYRICLVPVSTCSHGSTCWLMVPVFWKGIRLRFLVCVDCLGMILQISRSRGSKIARLFYVRPENLETTAKLECM